MKKHWGSTAVEWEVLQEEDATLARFEEKRPVFGYKKPSEVKWRCKTCQDMPDEPDKMTMTEVTTHALRKLVFSCC